MKRTMAGAVLAILFLPCAQAQNMTRIEQVMSKFYGNFDKSAKCWVGKSSEGASFCMKVSGVNFVNQQTYILAVGDHMGTLNDSAAHADSGNVGAFLIEEAVDGAKVVAAGPFNAVGSSGYAPQDWTFVQLGEKTRGWIGEGGGTFQGYTTGVLTVLMPVGRKIVDASKIVTLHDDSGACTTTKCTTLQALVNPDRDQAGVPYFNLLLTVKGTKDGKPYPVKQFVARFDAAKGEYVVPKGWPISGI